MAFVKLGMWWKDWPLSEACMTQAVANYFGLYQQMVFPNVCTLGWEMDVAVLSRSGYLSEVEIKLTMADFRADAKKAKWGMDRSCVTRFFYAVPASMVEAVIPLLPDGAGLISVRRNGKRFAVQEVKAARRTSKTKPSPAIVHALLVSMYHRAWRWRWIEQLRRADMAEKRYNV